ncbi:MAG: hypothetical protein A3C51_01365 [Omnitrophica bacterium RIFCSPHIGHO2_02_FULL_46_20]|nr:MAG: hypothetical protein A3C51_01365 [Omnitrophica bacterium RIFCSPHIGHO2_02_FULL_46_20]
MGERGLSAKRLAAYDLFPPTLAVGGTPPSTKCARRENKLLKLKLDEHCHPRALKTKGCSSGRTPRIFLMQISPDTAEKFLVRDFS